MDYPKSRCVFVRYWPVHFVSPLLEIPCGEDQIIIEDATGQGTGRAHRRAYSSRKGCESLRSFEACSGRAHALSPARTHRYRCRHCTYQGGQSLFGAHWGNNWIAIYQALMHAAGPLLSWPTSGTPRTSWVSGCPVRRWRLPLNRRWPY